MFKNITYTDVTAALPLRIVVGHKGIGKSALFKIAIEEDRLNGSLPLLIKPDDIAALGKDPSDFLLTIRSCKEGLKNIIVGKALDEFGLSGEITNLTPKNSDNITDWLAVILRERLQDNRKVIQEALAREFLSHRQIKVYIDDLDR